MRFETMSSWRWALVALRTFMGIVYFTNGLAKLFNLGHFNIGPWSQFLINRDQARGILTGEVRNPDFGISILRDFAHNFVLPNWDVLGWVVTAGELSVGLGLLLGVYARAAAVGGFLMAFLLFLWDLGGGGWTFDYLYDVVLLGILVLPPKLPGLDSLVRQRFSARSPAVAPSPPGAAGAGSPP